MKSRQFGSRARIAVSRNRRANDAGSRGDFHITGGFGSNRDLSVEARDAAIDRVNLQVEAEQQHGKVKVLVVDGHWNVPPEQRPAGWQKMAINERSTTVNNGQETVNEREETV